MWHTTVCSDLRQCGGILSMSVYESLKATLGCSHLKSSETIVAVLFFKVKKTEGCYLNKNMYLN